MHACRCPHTSATTKKTEKSPVPCLKDRALHPSVLRLESAWSTVEGLKATKNGFPPPQPPPPDPPPSPRPVPPPYTHLFTLAPQPRLRVSRIAEDNRHSAHEKQKKTERNERKGKNGSRQQKKTLEKKKSMRPRHRLLAISLSNMLSQETAV